MSKLVQRITITCMAACLLLTMVGQVQPVNADQAAEKAAEVEKAERKAKRKANKAANKAKAGAAAKAEEPAKKKPKAEPKKQEPKGPKLTLKPGDPAPALHVSKWINGEPVPNFERGKVYVIEAWATWCGPCIAAAPHVSKLAEQYKKQGVVVIGLNIWERDPSKVPAFVEKMGDKMSYVVAMDQMEGKMGRSALAWMAASGRNGIPSTFIVDREGKLAWMGHPMSMDEPLAQIVAGKFDIDAYNEKQKAVQAIQAKLRAAFQRKNWDEAIKQIDAMNKVNPSGAKQLLAYKATILLSQQQKYKEGYALVNELFNGDSKDDARVQNHLAWMILSDPGITQRDVPLALKIAQSAAKLTKRRQPAILDTLARAYYDSKDFGNAVKTQREAVSISTGRMKAELAQTLLKYEAKNAQGKPTKEAPAPDATEKSAVN